MPDPHLPESDLDLTQRRAAEVAALAASPSGARMLAAALDAGTEHIYVMDRDGRILFASRAGAESVGLTPPDLVGKTAAELGAPAEIVAKLAAEREQVLSTRRPVSGFLQHPTVHGPRDYEYTWTLFPRGAEDGAAAFIMRARDITEQSRVSQALSESDARFRILADSAPVLMWLNDESGCVFVNRAYLDFLGLDHQIDVRGYDWSEYILPDDRESYVSAYLRALERRAPFQAEFRFRRSDGEYRWMQSIGRPRLGADGAFLGYTGCTFDVHDTRIATARLRESEERFRAAVNHAAVGVALVDMDRKTLFVNLGLCEMLGYTEAEMLERSFVDVTHPDDLQLDYAHMGRLLSGQIPTCRYEKRFLRKDGTVVWGDLSVALVPDSDGQAHYAVGMLVDITERKRAEDEISRSREELATLNRRLQAAMSETHHRVKNNLQVIAALVDMQLLDRGSNGTVPTTELLRLVGHVRTLAAVHEVLTKNLHEEEREQFVSLRELFERLMRLLEQTAGPRAIRFTAQDARINSKQATAIGVVTNELVGNALKHGSGTIDVHLHCEDAHAVLKVCDEGTGYPPALDPQTSPTTGLQLVQAVVQNDLHGELALTNTPAGGACAQIRLPLLTS